MTISFPFVWKRIASENLLFREPVHKTQKNNGYWGCLAVATPTGFHIGEPTAMLA